MAGIARELGEQLVKLMAAFPDARRDAKLTMAVYAEALEGVPIGSLRVAVTRAIREQKFFPAAAELREYADAHALTIRAEALRKEGADTEHMALWRLRLAGYTQARSDGRKGYWPETWGPLPDDPECQAPDAILAAFGIVRALPPPRLSPEQLKAITDVARTTLAGVPGVPRREQQAPDTPGQRAVRDQARELGRAWHEQQDRDGRAA